MARGGRLSMDIDFKDLERNLRGIIHHVERGTKKATLEAVREIEKMTLEEVPSETGTLKKAWGYRIIRVGNRGFGSEMGYGVINDPVNPKTGERASKYMVAVHEDLQANHPHGGNAKFFEGPLQRYQQRFTPGVAKAIEAALRLGSRR